MLYSMLCMCHDGVQYKVKGVLVSDGEGGTYVYAKYARAYILTRQVATVKPVLRQTKNITWS